ncbi:HEPN domain-containing protein [Novosphingobium sp. PP1Y]|uniref:HEPN domain-containing protein n=1 Tax=Novosphingobium sp. PP1Y TaxID=702113 RepID=UPI00020EE7CD|nr:HEPN domain-containing protein [Novosphingobium sp. PP1Y]CCA91311.1 conserved hypothetical protein [Novosphingobium sp. PP1Y]
MSISSLAALLKAAATASPKPSVRDLSLAAWADIDPKLVSSVSDALNETEELKELWGKWAQFSDFGSLVQLQQAAYSLINRARDGYDSEAIVSDLFEIAKTSEVSFASVRAVTNLVVEERVSLAEGVYLAPPKELPNSNAKYAAFESGMQGDGGAAISSGKSALVVEITCKPFRSPPNSSGPSSEFSPELTQELEQKFERARAALILVGNAAPEFGVSYGYVANVGWPGMRSPGFGAAFRVPRQPDRISLTHEPSLKSIFEQVRTTDPIISLAIDRLKASRKRDTDLEKAIDHGLCLEVLLMRGAKTETTEITNKISHRCAWLLGRNAERRHEILKIVKMAYNLRSKAAHAGALPAIRDSDQADTRKRHFEDCERLIVNLIVRLMKGWPDWDELTLGFETRA